MLNNALKREFLTHLQIREWDRSEKHGAKQSFWPTDCLRPGVEIFWRWTNEPETNPIEPEKLLMFKAAKLFEEAAVATMIDCGHAVAPEGNPWGMPVSNGQFRVEMERDYVPVSGYMDAVHPERFPIEIKTFYGNEAKFENGMPPSEHYLHQLAVYMDFMDTDTGLLVSISRATGSIFYHDLRRNGMVFTCCNTSFDLSAEYKRWRRLMEDNILPRKEPVPEYEYRPTVTKELLDKYPEEKIKKAIKGERVLSDHRWRPQYCPWKNLWIKREAERKGLSVEGLCVYQQEEIAYMMDYLGVHWKTTKRGVQLHKIKER